MTPSLAWTLLCALALVGLLWSERARHRRGRFATKPLASAAFIAVAWAQGALAGGAYGHWIFVGLILGAIGDVALMFPSDRAFLGGLVAFLLGHVAYVVAFAIVTPPGGWAHPVTALPLLAAAVVVRWLWPHLGKMRVPVVAYVLVITTMAVAALAAQTSARRPPPPPPAAGPPPPA
ncbi:MAG: lysoplasmalogenase, partial [Polyangiaceae bacterium]